MLLKGGKKPKTKNPIKEQLKKKFNSKEEEPKNLNDEELIDDVVSHIDGMCYIRDFITPTEEQFVVSEIDKKPWDTDLKRRVQQYGYKFIHLSQQVELWKYTENYDKYVHIYDNHAL